MKRIYKRYETWECYPYGFYNNVSGIDKTKMKKIVVYFFSNPELTEEYMNLVLEKWPNSCEHNLTNESLNRIAWIGQASLCIYANIPYKVTMESWRSVPINFQKIADEIALKTLNKYLCLKNI